MAFPPAVPRRFPACRSADGRDLCCGDRGRLWQALHRGIPVRPTLRRLTRIVDPFREEEIRPGCNGRSQPPRSRLRGIGWFLTPWEVVNDVRSRGPHSDGPQSLHREVAAGDRQGDAGSACPAGREGGRSGRADAVPPGDVQPALFLPEPGREMVRRCRARARGPDDPAHAGPRQEIQDGDGRPDLRGGR